MMYKSNAFGYLIIMIILTLNMATNDGEMLFHFGDTVVTYTTAMYIQTYISIPLPIYILHILTVKVDIYRSYSYKFQMTS